MVIDGEITESEHGQMNSNTERNSHHSVAEFFWLFEFGLKVPCKCLA